MASRHSRQQVSCLQCRHVWPRELLVIVHGDQPETGLCVVVMAVSLSSVALDERRAPEVLQTRPGSTQRLSSSAVSNASVLEENLFNTQQIKGNSICLTIMKL